jgi:hypothetical protein
MPNHPSQPQRKPDNIKPEYLKLARRLQALPKDNRAYGIVLIKEGDSVRWYLQNPQGAKREG